MLPLFSVPTFQVITLPVMTGTAPPGEPLLAVRSCQPLPNVSVTSRLLVGLLPLFGMRDRPGVDLPELDHPGDGRLGRGRNVDLRHREGVGRLRHIVEWLPAGVLIAHVGRGGSERTGCRTAVGRERIVLDVEAQRVRGDQRADHAVHPGDDACSCRAPASRRGLSSDCSPQPVRCRPGRSAGCK